MSLVNVFMLIVNVFMLIVNVFMLIFLLKKMRVAYAFAKAAHIFSEKYL